MPESLRYASLDSPLGPVWAARTEAGLCQLAIGGTEREFLDRLRRRYADPPTHDPTAFSDLQRALEGYLPGKGRGFDLPLDLNGLSAFERRVLLALREVPAGSVATYGELAGRLGQPNAARAVGNALARNPLPILLPCHRVMPAQGGLGGFAAGPSVKARLLALEGWPPCS